MKKITIKMDKIKYINNNLKMKIKNFNNNLFEPTFLLDLFSFGTFTPVFSPINTSLFHDALYTNYPFGFEFENFAFDHEIILNIIHLGLFKSTKISNFFNKDINFSIFL